MFLDYYGVKLVALSNTRNNRDMCRLQTTVVTPFHLGKEIQVKLGIERDVALMTCETDFFVIGAPFISAMDVTIDKPVLEMKKVENNTIKTTHYNNWLECHVLPCKWYCYWKELCYM